MNLIQSLPKVKGLPADLEAKLNRDAEITHINRRIKITTREQNPESCRPAPARLGRPPARDFKWGLIYVNSAPIHCRHRIYTYKSTYKL
jgi:hypothetical protein